MSEFKNIVYNDAEKVFCYRSANVVYEEKFENGFLMSAGWNAAGFMLNVLEKFPTRLDGNAFTEPQVFDFEADGFSLNGTWNFVDFITENSVLENGTEICTGTLTLESTMKPVKVFVKTVLDGTDIITRNYEIENTGNTDIAVSHISSVGGGLEILRDWRSYLPGKTEEDIYKIGYPEFSEWGHEGIFKWHRLPNAYYSVCGRYMCERHRHPMFVLENNATGAIFINQLAWSGGYSFDFFMNASAKDAFLSYKVCLDSQSPFIILAAGESYEVPASHIGMIYGDLDDAVNTMHDHLRKSVFTLPDARGLYGLVEAGMGPERDMTVEATKHFADTASKVGAQALIIDAGWYCPPGTECSEWFARSGDWYPDKDRYPNGIEEIRDYIHEKGLLFGLWLDLESIGEKSKMFASHPDRVLVNRNGSRTNILDFTNPEVAEWAENELSRVIEEYKLDIFRLDNNIDYRNLYSYVKNGEMRECAYARYFKAVYKMYENLRRKYPDVIFENCAGGGGRTDIGLVSKFTHTWVSDWQKAPRAVAVTNGMTMFLPPENVDRLASGMESHVCGSLPLIIRHTLFGRPTVNDFNAVGSEFNDEQIEIVKHALDIYKNFIHPFVKFGRIYHHTPESTGEQTQGTVIMERSSKERDRSVIGVFRLAGETKDEFVTVFPRGINPGGKYEVTFDNTRSISVVDGFEIVNGGIKVKLKSALTSELILIKNVL